MSGEPATFTYWGPPDYYNRIPDISGFSDSPTVKSVDTVRSKIVAKALLNIQPMVDDGVDCAALVVFTFHLAPRWVKVPCGEPITTALPICEATPTTYPKADDEHLGTVVRKDEHGNKLTLPSMDCPVPYSVVGDKCFLLKTNPHTTNGLVKRDTPKGSCGEALNGIIANISQADVDNLSVMMASWRHLPQSGAIRVRHQRDYREYRTLLNASSEHMKDAMDRQNCWMIEPIASFNNSNGIDPLYTWKLIDMELDCKRDAYLKEHKVYSYLCEVDPVPIQDKCATNHFRCDDGTCILIHFKCDGINHCLDRSDETHPNCSEVSACYGLTL